MQLMLTPTSPYARSVRIALMIKGLDAECAMHWKLLSQSYNHYKDLVTYEV